MLNALLSHGEVGDDVGLEGKLQALTAELADVVLHGSLVGRVVHEDVHLAPLLHCLVYDVPATNQIEAGQLTAENQ